MESSHEDVAYNSNLHATRCDGLPIRRVSPLRKSRIFGTRLPVSSGVPSPVAVSVGNGQNHLSNLRHHRISLTAVHDSNSSIQIRDRVDPETDGCLSKQELNGLNIAGAALTLVSTVFTLFHPMYIVYIMAISDQKFLETPARHAGNIEEVFLDEQREYVAVTFENEKALQKSIGRSILKFFVFCIINPTLIVLSSWCIDFWSQTKNRQRTDFVRTSGCLFSCTVLLPFLLPLYEWSMCLYDLTYYFINIVIGSTFISSYNMTTTARISFLASSEVLYLIISLLSCQFGLQHFYLNQNIKFIRRGDGHQIVLRNDTIDYDDDYNGAFKKNRQVLGPFNAFLAAVVLIACFLFIIAHNYLKVSSINTTNLNSHEQNENDLENSNQTRLLPGWMKQDSSISLPRSSATPKFFYSIATLQQYSNWTKRNLYQLLFHHKNFRAWISTELLLKAQNSFISYFLYLFMGRLIGQTEQIFHHHLASTTIFSNFSAIFIILISKQIATIAMFVPISILGYRLTFRYLFDATLGLSVLTFLFGKPTSDTWIVGFGFLYTTITRATQAAGMYFIFSDLVLEIRHKSYVLDRRSNDNSHDPSFPALLLGVNAFFVKLTRICFAVLAEFFSKHMQYKFSTNGTDESDASSAMTDDSKRTLFFCVILMTSFCSIAQAISWRQYDLSPLKVVKMREEIQEALEQMNRTGRASTTTHSS